MSEKRAKVIKTYDEKSLQSFKNKDGFCNENYSLSLYDEGKSLHGVTQQDQDGLKTCYANTASLMLKSYNPHLPTPSYLDLASYNPESDDKQYAFDYGESCHILDLYKKSNDQLCHDEVIENQPHDIQDQILYKFSRLLDQRKTNVSNERLGELFQNYKNFLKLNPYPEYSRCEEDSLSLINYVNYKFRGLLDESFYFDDKKMRVEKDCYDIVKDIAMQNIKESSEEESVHYGEFKLKSDYEKKLNDNVLKLLKDKKLSKKRSYNDFILDLLNSKDSNRAIYSYVLSDKNTLQSQELLEKMTPVIKLIDEYIYNDVLSSLDSESQHCAEYIKKSTETPNEALFFNTLLGNCHRKRESWLYEVYKNIIDCKEDETDILRVFRDITSLGVEMHRIESFINQDNNKNLKSFVHSICRNKANYELPSKTCESDVLPAGLVSLASVEDWDTFVDFNKFLDEYQKIYPNKVDDKDLVDTTHLFDTFFKKINDSISFSDLSKDYLSSYQYNDLSLLFAEKLSYKLGEKIPMNSVKTLLKESVMDLKNKQKNMKNMIVQKLNSGKAIGVGSCSSLFSDEEKKSYPNCFNHAVTMTGVKCVQGRLKVELTNSWGIGCQDDSESQNLYQCQRDEEGLTNGRSWVDFDYLSDQGIKIYSY